MQTQDTARAARCARSLVPGQRVMARFDGRAARLGVVSGSVTTYGPELASCPVQFEPCGAHFSCYDVSPFGDANGWTDQEYRVARESSSTREHAASVEAERQARYPGAEFSAYIAA